MTEEIPQWFKDMLFDIEFLRNVNSSRGYKSDPVSTTEAVYSKYKERFKVVAMCGWTSGPICTCEDGTGETVECPHA